MAETKAGENISRQAFLQSEFAALTGSAAGYVFRADEFTQKPDGLAQGIAGLDAAFSPAFVDDRSRIVKILICTAEIRFAFQFFAVMLDFKTVSEADALEHVLRPGKLSVKHGLAGELDIGSKGKELVRILRVRVVHKSSTHLQE